MNGFRNFMEGRYGTDQLIVALLVVGMIFTFTGDIFRLSALTLLSYVAFFTCIYRTLSRNILARQKENNKFLQFWNPVKSKGEKEYHKLVDMKDYKYFKCPNCKQVLRVPRGRGKIAVTCKKCNTRFIKKS
jgi:hypothetical protein